MTGWSAISFQLSVVSKAVGLCSGWAEASYNPQ